MKCPKCGVDISDSAKFCTKCGTNVPEFLEKQAKAAAEEEAKRAAEEEAKKQLEAEATAKKTEKEAAKDVKTAGKNEKKVEKAEKVDKKTKKNGGENAKIAENTDAKVEGNKKKKKKHTGLKLLFILILILAIVCAGAYGLYRLDVLPDSAKDAVSPIFEIVDGWFGLKKDSDDKEEEKKDDDKKEETEDDKINKIDDDEDLVFDHYNKTMFGNTYKVPEINLDYDNIKKINDEIAKLVDSDLKQLEKETELPEMAPSGMEYVWYLNDNILSLVFFESGYHVDFYYAYNVDVYTGKTLENEDILDAAKIDEEDFPYMCSKAVEDYYKNYLYHKGIENGPVASEYNRAMTESTRESNFSTSKTPAFLNKNGELMIVAKVTTIAGAGSNYICVNVENLKKNSKSLFESKNLPNSSAMSGNSTEVNTNTMNTTNTIGDTNTVNMTNAINVTNATDTTNVTNTTNTTNAVVTNSVAD